VRGNESESGLGERLDKSAGFCYRFLFNLYSEFFTGGALEDYGEYTKEGQSFLNTKYADDIFLLYEEKMLI
jgi:hypothetical protein